MNEYIIVGDTSDYTGVLITLAGTTIERAREVLYDLLHDEKISHEHDVDRYSNIRIEEVEGKDCWWRDPFLVN